MNLRSPNPEYNSKISKIELHVARGFAMVIFLPCCECEMVNSVIEHFLRQIAKGSENKDGRVLGLLSELEGRESMLEGCSTRQGVGKMAAAYLETSLVLQAWSLKGLHVSVCPYHSTYDSALSSPCEGVGAVSSPMFP